jgi:hypothetical protein
VASPGSRPRLLEREAELAYLRGRLEDVREGRGGGIIAIADRADEPGAGQSRRRVRRWDRE